MKQEWLSTFPDFFPPVAERPSWNMSYPSEKVEKFLSFHASLDILLQEPPHSENSETVSLARALELRAVLLDWFSLSETQEALTVPFTEKGLVHAIAMAVEKNPESDSVLLLASMFPHASLQAFRLSSFPETFAHATLPVLPSRLNPATEEKTSPPPLQNVQNVSNEEATKEEAPKIVAQVREASTPLAKKSLSKNAKKAKKASVDRPVRPRHPAVALNASLLEDWLSSVDASLPLALQKDAWTRLVKQGIIKEKGVGEHAADYWFADNFLPGLCGLSKEKLERTAGLHSEHIRPTLTPPHHYFKDFWTYLRGMPAEDRQYLIDEAMPHFVDSSLWTFKDRVSFLEHILEGRQEKTWAVAESLRLWQALGGSLDEEGSLLGKDEEASVFSSTPTSARSRLLSLGFKDLPETAPSTGQGKPVFR